MSGSLPISRDRLVRPLKRMSRSVIWIGEGDEGELVVDRARAVYHVEEWVDEGPSEPEEVSGCVEAEGLGVLGFESLLREPALGVLHAALPSHLSRMSER